MKKITSLAVACAAAFSLGAVAAEDKEQKQQPQAQTGQSESASGGATQKQASQSPEMIKQAQEKLSAAGHDVQPDGIMGPKTQAALKEFQQSKGLKASGELDQETIAALGVSEGASTGASAGGGASSGSEQPKAQEQPKETSK